MPGRPPVQRPQSPQISEGRSKNRYEDDRLDITRPAQFTKSNGPGKKEYGFYIEDHKEHCDQIEFGREAQARKADGDNAAFKRLIRSLGAMTLANDVRKRHDAHHQHD